MLFDYRFREQGLLHRLRFFLNRQSPEDAITLGRNTRECLKWITVTRKLKLNMAKTLGNFAS